MILKAGAFLPGALKIECHFGAHMYFYKEKSFRFHQIL